MGCGTSGPTFDRASGAADATGDAGDEAENAEDIGTVTRPIAAELVDAEASLLFQSDYVLIHIDFLVASLYAIRIIYLIMAKIKSYIDFLHTASHGCFVRCNPTCPGGLTDIHGRRLQRGGPARYDGFDPPGDFTCALSQTQVRCPDRTGLSPNDR